jgi:hypothetical protein
MFIFRTIRLAVHFVIFFFIMLIPVKQDMNMFEFLEKKTAPTREKLLKESDKIVSASWNSAKKLGKNLFTNSEPKTTLIEKVDSISTKKSAPKRTNSPLSKIIKREELEHIGEDDMRRLDKFLKEN